MNNLLGAHLTEDLRRTCRCVCWIRQRAESSVCVCVYACMDMCDVVTAHLRRDANRHADMELLTALDISTSQRCRAVLLLSTETLVAGGHRCPPASWPSTFTQVLVVFKELHIPLMVHR